jgi:DNA-binding NtrC family response regulator
MRAGLQTDEGAPPLACVPAERAISRVLLVEDSMLIALDAEDSLTACGVGEVVIAGNVAAALAAIVQEPPDFAALDYNPGAESSEPIARTLDEAGVPFCFATGYGDALERSSASPPYGVLKKPYSRQDVADVLARVEADRARV